MKIKLVLIIALQFILAKINAQLCQGSLGDPIVNITFGAGANPGAPIPGAATGYQYVPTDCPDDGFYTVRSSSFGCFSNSWHNIQADHTGNANGYFMLVNASIQPRAFYLDTVRGLCGNTTYEFAAWVMNVIRAESCGGNSIQPNLTFRIEKTSGTLLQFYNTNNVAALSTPEWKQFGFFFTTPSVTTDIVLRIVNNASGGCGNDIALDDITFRPCGPLLTPSIDAQSTNSATLCEGIGGTFSFSCTVSGGFANPSYQWQARQDNGAWTDIPGETGVTLTRNFPANAPIGSYAYRLAVAESGNMGSAQCRIASPPLTINVVANPVTTTANSSPVCEGNSVSLTATGGILYQWSGPGGFTGNGSTLSINNIQAQEAGKYYVLVQDNAGCQSRDSTIVAIDPLPTGSTTFQEAKICPGDSVSLSATGGISYNWVPAMGLSSVTDPSPQASPAVSTEYMVVVSNSFNCTDTAYVNVKVLNLPQADAGADKFLIEGESVQLAATASGDHINYSWNTSPYLDNATSLYPVVNPVTDTKFIFTVASLDGCGMDSDTMQVTVYKNVFVPNAFTPNGDGINDTWNIPALNAFKHFELFVFNRYGERVFYLKDYNRPWDGTFLNKRLSMGVYIYLIDFDNFMPPLKGTVTIIR